jgi:hypothetical protein
MNIQSLLKTQEYIGLSDIQVVELANEKRHHVYRNVFHTYRSLASTVGIGPDATRRLIQTLDIVAMSDPLVSEIRHVLRGEVGLNVNDQITLSMLDLFAGNEQLPLTTNDVLLIKGLSRFTESDADINRLGIVTIEQLKRLRIEGEIE